MNYTLIMLDNPILVSDEEVNPHNAVWDFENNQVTVLRQSYGLTNYKKIVAGLPDLPKLDLSLIAKEIGWVDVEKLALKEYPKDLHRWAENQFDDFNESDRNTWINGFKAAQSLNEKNYSKADMIEYAEFFKEQERLWSNIKRPDSWEREGRGTFDFWLSKRKPKEYQVELEMEQGWFHSSGYFIEDKTSRPKITNNTITVTKILK